MNIAYHWRRKLAFSFAIVLSCGAGQVFVPFPHASAQSRAEAISIIVPPALEIAPSSETQLPIQILPGNAVPRRSIVLIKGLPSTMTLSGGRLFESGVWGIASTDIGVIKVASSSAATGRSDLTISLVSLDGSLIAEAASSLNVRAASMPVSASADFSNQAVLTAAPPQDLPKRAPEPARRLTAAQTEQLLAMVRKADEQIRVGDVSAARLLYRHAAESGLAAAALALAATYDEQELYKNHKVIGGVKPDAKMAQFWYEKARELGSPEARDHLVRLGSR